MKINIFTLISLMTVAVYLDAQDTSSTSYGNENSSSLFQSSGIATASEAEATSETAETSATHSYGRSTSDTEISQHASNRSATDSPEDESKAGSAAKDRKSILSNVQWGGTVDMQADKEMWDELSTDSKNRLQSASLNQWYRKVMDDFWLRVALRAKYSSKYFESAFALRFYPYWTMRRKGDFQSSKDLDRYLELFEINQAYLKTFKDYKNGDNEFGLHFKIGRDGLLSTGSQLFGNYLELPTGGYGESRSNMVTGPFKNRKVFANQLEIGLNFKIGDVISGTTSLMRGSNVNNRQWYTAPEPAISEEMDSRLSAGFTRGYQDLIFWNERIHLGAGFRVYTTKVTKSKQLHFINESNEPDSTETTFITDSKYVNGDWTFDVTFLPGLKLYSEFGYQRLGSISETGIIRPFTAGLTIPTGEILDLLAVEIENVSNTFFSNVSRRDPIGNRKATKSFAWGIVIDKWFIKDRAGVSWGVYTGNAYGDMKTSLRLTSNF
jgi:hypothetical protein